ncbi:MAG: hypothetical protein ABW036_04925 [Flavitalea sp.]
MLKTRYKLIALLISSMIFQHANAQKQDSLFARIKPLTQETDPVKVEKAMDTIAVEFKLDPIDDAESLDIGYIERLSKRTIDLYNSYRFDSTARPGYFPKEDWNRFIKMAEVPYYHSHAHVLFSNNKERVALLYFEMAIVDTGEPVTDIETIGFYSELLLANCKNDRAYRLLLNTAKSG